LHFHAIRLSFENNVRKPRSQWTLRTGTAALLA